MAPPNYRTFCTGSFEMNIQLCKASIRTKRTLYIITMVHSVLILGLLCGCPCKTDENSGEDSNWGGAEIIPFDQVITDEIHPEACDNTDWKILQVGTSGFLTTNVYWDNEKATGKVGLYDRFGIELATKKHLPKSGRDQMVITVEPAYYFLKVEGTKYRSTYSVQAFFQPGKDQINNNNNNTEPIPEWVSPIEED